MGAAAALLVLTCLVQIATYFAFFGYCDEFRLPGTARAAVCGEADAWGFVLLLLAPPVLILAGALAAWIVRNSGILVYVTAASVGLGVGVPLLVAVVGQILNG